MNWLINWLIVTHKKYVKRPGKAGNFYIVNQRRKNNKKHRQLPVFFAYFEQQLLLLWHYDSISKLLRQYPGPTDVLCRMKLWKYAMGRYRRQPRRPWPHWHDVRPMPNCIPMNHVRRNYQQSGFLYPRDFSYTAIDPTGYRVPRPRFHMNRTQNIRVDRSNQPVQRL